MIPLRSVVVKLSNILHGGGQELRAWSLPYPGLLTSITCMREEHIAEATFYFEKGSSSHQCIQISTRAGKASCYMNISSK